MRLMNLFSLIPAYSALYRDVARQKRFMREQLLPLIKRARDENDGSLDEDDFSKIRNYYGFGVPAIVGEAFCTLRGRPMSEQERIASTFQGALTGLYDDFFDKTGLDTKAIRAMMESPFSYQANTSLERLFIVFLQKVHQHLPGREYFIQSFNRVFEAQLASRKQKESPLSPEEIREVTYRKGGHSLLFYRSVFEHAIVDGEEEALYQAGALMQLGNDIFDVYDDSREGIMTLPASCMHIGELREDYRMQMARIIRAVDEMNFPSRNKRRFLQKFLLGMTRCQVCMDQLEKLEEKTNNTFKPLKYSRKELICDMEKRKNILRSLRHYLSQPF